MKPVFVAGCERSGTTMLGALLGQLDHVVCLPESPFIGDLAMATTATHGERLALARSFERHPRFRDWREVGCTGLRVPDRLEGGYPAFVSSAVAQYAAAVNNVTPSWFVEHWPRNIVRIDRLIDAFPDAKVLHVVRDGRAVAASLLAVDWGPNDIKAAALLWSARLGAGLAAEQRFGANVVHRVHYECLVTRPEETLAAICSFAGIPIRRTMGNSFRVPSSTRAMHRLVGESPSPARIEAWKHTLTPRQIEVFEATAGGLLTCLQYAREIADREPRPQTVIESARHHLRGPLVMSWQHLRRTLRDLVRQARGTK